MVEIKLYWDNSSNSSVAYALVKQPRAGEIKAITKFSSHINQAKTKSHNQNPKAKAQSKFQQSHELFRGKIVHAQS